MFHKKEILSIGVDISDTTLKGVLLEKTSSNFSIISHAQAEIPTGVISENTISDPIQLGSLLEHIVRTLQGGHLRHTLISIPLPEPETFLTTLTLHPSGQNNSPEMLEPLITEEIKQHIPIDPEQLIFDWQISEQTAMSTTVVVAAAPRSLVDTFTQVFSSQRLIPLAFEIESIAIARALIPIQNRHPQDTTIIIDLGAHRSGLSLVQGTTVHMAVSAPLSSASLIESIAHNLKQSNKEGQDLLFSLGIEPAKTMQKTYRSIVESAIHDLITRVQDVIQFSQEHLHETMPQTVLLTGGGARMKGIASYLSQELHISTQEADPLTNILHSLSHPCPIPPHERHHFTTAIGLALRPFI